MNNPQVAHLWANKSRQSANGSHFYFEGDTIYSYGSHFPIARHHKGAVLMTSKSYSPSTAKHKAIIRMACRHLEVFTVSDVRSNPSAKMVKEYQDRIKSAVDQLGRMRSPGNWDIERVTSLIDEGNRFCTRFDRARRFEQLSPEFLAQIRERAEKAEARKAVLRATKRQRQEEREAKAIAEWIAGERDALGYYIHRIFLRLKGENVETSRGAVISRYDAHRTFCFAMSKRESGWHRNGEQFAIGDFQLDAVNEFGIIAGCHRIDWAEIIRFAKLQGWA